MDWVVHGVTKSRTRLSDFHFFSQHKRKTEARKGPLQESCLPGAETPRSGEASGQMATGSPAGLGQASLRGPGGQRLSCPGGPSPTLLLAQWAGCYSGCMKMSIH